jgi:hypothetical protein
MSWKPSRGSGIVYDRHYNNANKYRRLTYEHFEKLTFPDLKKASRYLYSWYTAEVGLKKFFGTKKAITIEMLICRVHLDCLLRNRDIIYKPPVEATP